MTFINPNELGLYAPKTNEKIKLAAEAEKYITEAIFTYKQLFYGLRSLAWNLRDKKATFYEALTNGELEQFKVAPGHRDSDGSYTKDEWDHDRLNAYMWNRFRERFDAAFNLETIAELKTLKDIRRATNEFLQFALANWGTALLGDQLEEEVPSSPIGQGVTRCQLDYQGIKITGQFLENKRTIILSAPDVLDVMVHQIKGETCWSGSIHFDSFGNPVRLNSKTSELFSKMLALASRLNLGIKEFMANPEGFLGIESDKAHQRNLELIKNRLLEINQDNYERRKAQAEQKRATRRINEAIDAAEEIAEDTEANEEAFEEARHQADRVLANERHKLVQPTTHSKVTIKQRKLTKQQEAEEWLKNNPEFLENVDAQMGISSIDT